MDGINFSALLSFALITSFTPGPNNISCASLGVLQGYRKTLPYIGGILVGFFGFMLLSSWVSAELLARFPAFESALRIAGALYILWLAYHTLRASYAFQEAEGERKIGFINGFLLQALNPKTVFYGLTLFGTFLAPISGRLGLVLTAAAGLSVIAFLAISTWTLFGAAIRGLLKNPRLRFTVNLVLALLLVYTALDISGLLG